jgi:putative transposase
MAQPPRLQSIVLPADTPIIYFVTICVQNRERVLANPVAWDAVVAILESLRRWYVCSAVVMPDHFHALIAPCEDRDIPVGDFFTGFKRLLRQSLRHTWTWQRSGFDRLLRSRDDSHRQWLYMRDNPVRAGLVRSWDEWPYCFDYRGSADVRAR